MFASRTSPTKTFLAVICAAVVVLSVGCRTAPTATEPAPAATPTPVSTATATPPPAWQDPDSYRQAMLTGAADDVELIEMPTFYHIEADVDTAGQPPRIYALQDTHYTNKTNTSLDRIYFRLFPNKPSFGSALTFEQVTVGGVQLELEYESEGTAVALILPQPLEPGQSVDVRMAYDVTVPSGNVQGYGTFNHEDGIYLLSNFFAMVAVYDENGWNLSLAPDYGDPVYAETSFYTVDLTVPDGMVVVTSGSTIAKQDNTGDTTTWTCVSGPMRDFMVVLGESLESASTAVGYIRVNSYHLPEHEQAGEQMLAYARDCLRAYQQSFGPYPFAEFDVVEAPIFAGGMEYPGLVMVAEEHYESMGETAEFVLAHEVAHQWWYSLVGNDQVNVPWLDESLANFATMYYYEQVYGESRAELTFETFMEGRYERAKAAGRDAAVYQPVAAFGPQDYGPIVYGKGAVFFYELREKLGRDMFLAFLRRYLEEYKYKLATPDDLLRVAQEVSGQELDAFYEEWILSAG